MAVGASALCATGSSKARRVGIAICRGDIAGTVKYGFDYIEPAPVVDTVAMDKEQFPEYPTGCWLRLFARHSIALFGDRIWRWQASSGGFPCERAQAQIAAFLRMASDVAPASDCDGHLSLHDTRRATS